MRFTALKIQAIERYRTLGFWNFLRETLYFVIIKMTVLHVLGSVYRWISTRRSAPDLPTRLLVESGDIEYISDFKTHQFPVEDSKTTSNSPPIVGVFGGPWDMFKSPWHDSLVYQTLSAKFEEECTWKKTHKYRSAEAIIRHGGRSWSSSNMDALRQKIAFLENLHASMERHGYISQSEIETYSSADIPKPDASWKSVQGERFPNECFVGIGRNGEIIRFTGAHHRVSLAKLLDLSQVPVIVVVRHSDWQRKREIVASTTEYESLPASVAQYLDHPDIVDLVSG